MFGELKKNVIITGHYGCGKTNFAVNLALWYRAVGEETTVLDIDIVNPYFRSADFGEMLAEKGIEIITPNFANSLLDSPSLPARMQSAFYGGGRVIADVGGDDAGAVALKRYRRDIENSGGADMLYLFNAYRPDTGSAKEVSAHIGRIEAASGQKAAYLVNSSNLGAATRPDDVERTAVFAREVAAVTGLPLLATVVVEEISGNVAGCFAVKRYVKPPWEQPD